MTMMMQQCKMERAGVIDTAWIDARRAREGAVVDIKVDGVWQRGWTITAAYQPQLPVEVVQKRERDFKTHRKATDV